MFKRIILIAALLMPATAFAGGNDIRMTQRNAADTANINRDLAFPAASAHGIVVLNGSTVLPQSATLAGGLVFNGTALTTSAIPQANISGLVGDLDGKVDKVTGKGLSTEDFTTSEKSKLSGIATAATANDTDANLKARANHTGTQAISTVTGLQSALDDKATVSALTALAARVTALENWQAAVKVARVEVFTVTTGSGGDFTLNTSTAFTSPKIIAAVGATAGAEGYHAHISSVSGTTINGRAFKNKTQGVLLGGTIDPDDPVASSTTIHVVVVQGS